MLEIHKDIKKETRQNIKTAAFQLFNILFLIFSIYRKKNSKLVSRTLWENFLSTQLERKGGGVKREEIQCVWGKGVDKGEHRHIKYEARKEKKANEAYVWGRLD